MPNPWDKMTLCPLCFGDIELGKCDIVDVDNPSQVIEHGRSDFFGNPVQLKGTKYLRARRECYLCHGLLPNHIGRLDGQIIGLVGSGGSGKSSFIVSLINEVTRGCRLDGIGVSVEAGDDLYDQSFDDYYRILYKQKSALPFSIAVSSMGGQVIRPFIYPMIHRDGTLGAVRRANLYLFDTSGEDMVDQSYIARFSKYIYNSTALIILIDPFSIPNISERIAQPFQPDDLPTVDGYEQIKNVIGVIRQYRGLLPGDTIPIPAAIVLAKSDLLKYVVTSLRGVTSLDQCEFLREPDYRSASALWQSMTQVDAEIRDLIRQADGEGILKLSETFSAARFFAISATGCPVDKTSKTYSRVRPLRCPDPLIWLLWTLGIAPSPAA